MAEFATTLSPQYIHESGQQQAIIFEDWFNSVRNQLLRFTILQSNAFKGKITADTHVVDAFNILINSGIPDYKATAIFKTCRDHFIRLRQKYPGKVGYQHPPLREEITRSKSNYNNDSIAHDSARLLACIRNLNRKLWDLSALPQDASTIAIGYDLDTDKFRRYPDEIIGMIPHDSKYLEVQLRSNALFSESTIAYRPSDKYFLPENQLVSTGEGLVADIREGGKGILFAQTREMFSVEGKW